MDYYSAEAILNWTREQLPDWRNRYSNKVVGCGLHHKTLGHELTALRPENGMMVYVTVKGSQTSRRIYSLILKSLASVTGIGLPEGYGNIYVDRRLAPTPSGVDHPERWADRWQICITALEKRVFEQAVRTEDSVSGLSADIETDEFLGHVADNEEASYEFRHEVEELLKTKRFAGDIGYSNFVGVTPSTNGLMVLIHGLRGSYDAQTAMSTIVDKIGSVTGVLLYDSRKIRFTGNELSEGRYGVLVTQLIRRRADAEEEED